MMFLRSRLKFRYSMSFFLVLLIPMTAFTVFLFRYVSAAMEKQAIRTSTMLLEQIDNQMDTQRRHFSAIATQVSTSDLFKPFSFRDTPTTARSVIQEMHGVLNANGFASEMLLFERADEFFYSSTSSFTDDSFLAVYDFADYGGAEFLRVARECVAPAAFPVGTVRIIGRETDQYAAFLFPLYHSGSHTGTLAFLVDGAHLRALLNLYSGSDFLELSIVSGAGVVYPGGLSAEENARLVEVAYGAAGDAVRSDSDGYTMIRISSGELDWRYVMRLSRESLLAPVQEIQTRAYVLLSAALIVGVVSVMLLTNYHYHPIRQLRNELERATDGVGDDLSLNELGQIRAMCARLIREKQALQTDRAEMRRRLHEAPAMRQYCLYRLLQGDIAEVAEALNAILDAANAWCVLVAAIDAPERGGARHGEWMEALLAELGGRRQTLLMLSPEGRYIIMLTACPEAVARDGAFFERLHALLADVVGGRAALGVGSVYDSPGQAHISYLEAMQALAHRFVSGEGSVFFFREASQRPAAADEYARGMSDALKRGDWAAARGQGDELLLALTRANVPLYLAKGILSDALSLSRRVGERVPEGMNALSVAAVWDFDALYRKFSDALDELIDAHARTAQSAAQDSRPYEQYLAEHAYDVSFSLAAMAEDFSLSQGRLNQKFKESTGATVWDTVIRMRTRRAQELLADTEMTMQEIVALIGYQDVSSFVRRFKRTEGVTPGEYRQQARGRA